MNRKIKILVAEDDTNIREGLVDFLEMEGYEVKSAENGSEAIKKYSIWTPDLLLLDVMMPKINGYDVCKDIRRGNPDIPIIMLTAKSEEIDKVLGLELGADDYVTKPFSLRELKARISAILRRVVNKPEIKTLNEENDFQFGSVTVSPQNMKAKTDRGEIDLSMREIKLLTFFHQHPGIVLERNDILAAVWGENYGGFTRTLDQHIAQLRKKVEPDPQNPQFIQTVYGIGYRYISKS